MSTFKRGLSDALKSREAPTAEASAQKPRKQRPPGASNFKRERDRALAGEPALAPAPPASPPLAAALKRAQKAQTDLALGAAVSRASRALKALSAPPVDAKRPSKMPTTASTPTTPPKPSTAPEPLASDVAFFPGLAVARGKDDPTLKAAGDVRVVKDAVLARAVRVAGKDIRKGTRVRVVTCRDDAAWKALTKGARATQADADALTAPVQKALSRILITTEKAP